jgi:SpoVK/Ycf46/Vps4 family AAA+-type ATPase
LYVLELGELGTTADQVEENLNRVFTRVVRWNAVLQFDECEIFLAKRGNDLERSAIVGIFLRLLDYYRGILFLTTNRADVLDTAVLSRVTLRLSYPDLTKETRLSIWQTMLSVANLQTDDQMGELTSLPLNGRQIRNIVRLARIVHAGKSVTANELKRLVYIAVPDLPTHPIPQFDPSID